jgi:hypothetical protein
MALGETGKGAAIPEGNSSAFSFSEKRLVIEA